MIGDDATDTAAAFFRFFSRLPAFGFPAVFFIFFDIFFGASTEQIFVFRKTENKKRPLRQHHPQHSMNQLNQSKRRHRGQQPHQHSRNQLNEETEVEGRDFGNLQTFIASFRKSGGMRLGYFSQPFPIDTSSFASR